MESNRRSERTKAALDRDVAAGQRLGRPGAQQVVDLDLVARLKVSAG